MLITFKNSPNSLETISSFSHQNLKQFYQEMFYNHDAFVKKKKCSDRWTKGNIIVGGKVKPLSTILRTLSLRNAPRKD